LIAFLHLFRTESLNFYLDNIIYLTFKNGNCLIDTSRIILYVLQKIRPTRRQVVKWLSRSYFWVLYIVNNFLNMIEFRHVQTLGYGLRKIGSTNRSDNHFSRASPSQQFACWHHSWASQCWILIKSNMYQHVTIPISCKKKMMARRKFNNEKLAIQSKRKLSFDGVLT